ncbi:ABC transporter ATP-binding protein [Serratia sp. UGAL515B_01]|uniref:ABC transporter ATP-binding protein n=1 Tax=Serratia sp. UGAL515B_01 TaxID=2986763 RepID=UPI0029559B12|nr:ABC transporter ATP-binding protein [Serratia sp. UGAL515B_01]WON76238.1 ABC transporter ATP-binding protein [Serratia sp. UGAL515B_01]
MGISEEESIRRLALEKNSVGNSAKWVAIVSAVYFVLMLFYGHPIGVLAMSGSIFIVSAATWFKKRQKVKAYRLALAKISNSETP